MKDLKEFSLSYYLDELKRREGKKAQEEVSAALSATTVSIEVLKAIKEAKDHQLPLTTLARKVNLKIAPCQEVCEHLRDEGLIEIEPDQETGNDWIKLSDKGMGLL